MWINARGGQGVYVIVMRIDTDRAIQLFGSEWIGVAILIATGDRLLRDPKMTLAPLQPGSAAGRDRQSARARSGQLRYKDLTLGFAGQSGASTLEEAMRALRAVQPPQQLGF